jgi:hypothetical protein
MDGREDPFRLSPLAYGEASRRTPFLLRALWATRDIACNAIWPKQFAPPRLLRNLSQLTLSGSHLGTKYGLLAWISLLTWVVRKADDMLWIF